MITLIASTVLTKAPIGAKTSIGNDAQYKIKENEANRIEQSKTQKKATLGPRSINSILSHKFSSCSVKEFQQTDWTFYCFHDILSVLLSSGFAVYYIVCSFLKNDINVVQIKITDCSVQFHFGF